VISHLLLGAIKGYQRWLSPLLGASCRYLPTCSAYACEAIEIHGGAKGSVYMLRRLCSCHPFGGSGYDPVPPKQNYKKV
jgi:putative membrane protein insertion efficiency factor